MTQEKGFYLYGIIKANPTSHVSRETSHGFQVGQLEVLIKEVSLEEFGEEPLQRNLKDVQWLERQLWEHERMLEAVMQQTTVLPMKFGVIFTSLERLAKSLREHEGRMLGLLEQLSGQEEWGVKVFSDRSRIEERVKQESTQVKALQAQQATQPSGTAYLVGKKLAELIREEVDLALAKEARSIYDQLLPYTTQAKQNQPMGQGLAELTGRHGEMILNAAFLVRKGRVNDLAVAVEYLRKAYHPKGFELEQVGPFPPYNFTSLDLDPEKEEAAIHE